MKIDLETLAFATQSVYQKHIGETLVVERLSPNSFRMQFSKGPLITIVSKQATITSQRKATKIRFVTIPIDVSSLSKREQVLLACQIEAERNLQKI